MPLRARLCLTALVGVTLLQLGAAYGPVAAAPRTGANSARDRISMTVDGVDRALVSNARDDAGAAPRVEPQPFGVLPSGAVTAAPSGEHDAPTTTTRPRDAQPQNSAHERAPPSPS
jgi:hypothetical protein